MAFFRDENAVRKLPPRGKFQAGVANADTDKFPERGITWPGVGDPTVTFLDYSCWVEVVLDPGTVLHKALPQTTQTPDDLGVIDVANQAALANFTGPGVNTATRNTYTDTIQQMATSTFIFALRGYARRIGYQVPIPKLLQAAGVAAVPTNPQRAYNRVIGNLGGIPVFFAQWDKWYLVSVPVKAAQVPPANLAVHMDGKTAPPQAIQVPYSLPDYNAVDTPQAPGAAAPPANLGNFGAVQRPQGQ